MFNHFLLYIDLKLHIKMTITTSLPILLGLIFHTLHVIECENIYILPTSSTICLPGELCMEVNDWIKYAKNVSSNTNVIFMPGIHRVDMDTVMIFRNIDHIKLLGLGDGKITTVAEKVKEYGFDHYSMDEKVFFYESPAKIICDNGKLAFVYTNVSNVEITNLTIVNCGLYSSATLANASIHMINVSNLRMERVSIQNSTGYGLWGVNIVGQSQFLYSSFVGNNQYVKGKLLKKVLSFPQDDGETTQNTITAYENNGSLNCNAYTGGNVVLNYKKPSPGNASILISSCHFSLAVDGSYTPKYINLCSAFNGIGLSLNILQGYPHYLSIRITDTVFYRNQAKNGANLQIQFDTSNCNISLTQLTSMYGIGLHSGLRIWAKTLIARTKFQSDFKVGGSIFKYNFSPQEINPPTFFYSALPSFSMYFSNNSFYKSDVGIEGQTTNQTTIFDSNIFNQSFIHLLDGSTLVNNIQFNYCYFSYSSFSNTDNAVDKLNLLYTGCIFEKSGITVSSSTTSIISCSFIYSRLNAIDTSVTFGGNVTFAHNSFNNNGGAISLYSANATFQASSNVTFMNNTAVNGGSIYMDETSYLVFPSSNSIVTFINNTAKFAGGAIYTKSLSSSYISSSVNKCFIHSKSTNIGRLYFEANSAEEAGSVLYGGMITSCAVGNFKNFIIGSHNRSSSLITSEPIFICQCLMGENMYDASKSLNFTQNLVSVIYTLQSYPAPKCQLSSLINSTVYPGQIIQVPFITYGQAYGNAPALVHLYSNDSEISFFETLRSSPTCKIYYIKPRLVNGSMYLATEAAFSNERSYDNNIEISIKVLPCPTGFVLDNNSSSCVCTSLLQRYNLNCRIEYQTLQTSGSHWIGYTSQNILGVLEQCPFDYCKTDETISATHLDAQCAFSRQGILCGQCLSGLSMNFGTSQCKKCSNYYLLLIIPFALMGVALVGLLFILNLTVSAGTLSGIIFYTNVIKINDKIFFPSSYASSYSSLFYLFIAWFNLDFGIESCFYNGMDSYAKVWLQFAFPFYIFCLVGVIIIAGRYSSVVSKLCRFNAVSVLATLIQLSYSKILRVIITILSSASIDTQDAATPPVWLYDGNIEYLGTKHLFLFTIGLVVLSLFIFPYTFLLLFIPCLQSRSHWKLLKWVNMLKPFFDCHTAPYKDKYRFWAGVLLVMRFPLYILFALTNSTNIKLLGILIFVTIYTNMFCWFLVYRKWYHNLLEMFFFMNLATLAIVHLFQPSSITSLSVNIILTVGTGLSFIGFIAVLIIHICIRLEIKCQVWNALEAQRSNATPTTVLTSPFEVYINTSDNKSEDNTLRDSALEL